MSRAADRGPMGNAWDAFGAFFAREDVYLYVQVAFMAWHVFSVLVMLVMGTSGRWPAWAALMAGVVVVGWLGLGAGYKRRSALEVLPQVDDARDARFEAMREGFEAARHEDGPVFENVEICVRFERRFQRQRHGDEDHADVAAPECGVDTVCDEGVEGEALRLARVARAHGIPSAPVAKALCEAAFREGRGTWAHILVEEVAEAVEAAAKTPCCAPHRAIDLEHELYQVAASAMAWAEHSRRRRGDGAVGGECEGQAT